MARQATKQLGVRTIKSLNVGFYGNEPIYNRELSSKELQDALTWYNYNMDSKDGVLYLVEYLNKNNRTAEAKAVKSGGDKYFSTTLFKLARIISVGGSLPSYAYKWFEDGMSDGIRKMQSEKKIDKYEEPKKLNERNAELLNEISSAIDTRNSKFDVGKYLNSNSITKEKATKIAKFYQDELNSHEKVLKPNDDIDQKEITSYLTYFDKIVKGIKIYAGIPLEKAPVVRKPRKPRAKKIIPPEKKVASLKFLSTSEELNVKSIKPVDIIGKMSLWVYDVKANKLTNFKAKNETGLDIKGTTVINYDETLSECKRIGRKAKTLIPTISTLGKVSLRKVFVDIKSAKIAVSGRINENTLLLRIDK